MTVVHAAGATGGYCNVHVPYTYNYVNLLDSKIILLEIVQVYLYRACEVSEIIRTSMQLHVS